MARDDVTLYDIPPAFQKRLLKWLDKGDGVQLTAYAGGFNARALGPYGEPFTARTFEAALLGAMKSRAEEQIDPEFGRRVHAWLEAHDAEMTITSPKTNQFRMRLLADDGRLVSDAIDEDLEVALVFAEDQFLALVGEAPEEEPEMTPARTRHREEVEPETIAAETRAAETRAMDPKTTRTLFDDQLTMPARYSRNADMPPPRRGARRSRELPSVRRMVEREEARQRRAERPFDPEAPRAQYAKAHHFAVNEKKRSRKYRGQRPWSLDVDAGYGYGPSETGRYVLFHDSCEVMRGTEAEIWKELHRHPYSVEHALRHEGYHIEAEVPMAVNSSWPEYYEDVVEELKKLGLRRSDADDYASKIRASWSTAQSPARVAREIKAIESGELRQNQERDVLRDVMLADTGYRLVLWDTHRTGEHGKSILGYEFFEPGDSEPLFTGEDFNVPPSDVVDSDETLRSLLGFLTLRPGDTDREYFDAYTPRQMAFAKGDAEELAMFGMDDPEFDPPPLVDR